MSVIQPIYPRIQLHFLTCQMERLIYKIRQTFLYKPWAHTTSEKDLMKYIRALWFKPWPRTLNTHRITPYHGSQWFCPCFRGWFWPNLYFFCQTSTWHLDSCHPEDTWCGVILWVLRVLGQGFNQSAQIFFTRVFSGCYAILTSPKEGETAVYGYNPALFWVLSVSCWCLAELMFT